MSVPLRISVSDAQSLCEYNREVFDRFARRARRLRGEEAFRKRGIGHESLFATLVHILNVQEVWLTYIVRGRNSDQELGALFDDARRKPTDWAGFRAYSTRVWKGIDETLGSLTPAAMGRTVSVFWMPGTYTVRDAFLQVTMEEAHHLGEVIGALWQDDVASPVMTWIDVRRPPRKRRRHRGA